MNRIIDTHSHLYLDDFDLDISLVIARAKAEGVAKIFLPNIDSATLKPMLDLCKQYSGYCYPMIGLHPTSVKEDYMQELAVVESELESAHSYIAVGEIGLDLYWDKSYFDAQLAAFERQIQLALKHDLPVVIHSREAHEPLCEVLSLYKETSLRGVFHSFTGTADELRQLLTFERFMIGVNGVVTFKNSTLSEVLKGLPLTRLLLETDSPYLTPAPNRGKRNESAYLKYVLHKLADVYKIPSSNVAAQTLKNSLDMFCNGVLEGI